MKVPRSSPSKPPGRSKAVLVAAIAAAGAVSALALAMLFDAPRSGDPAADAQDPVARAATAPEPADAPDVVLPERTAIEPVEGDVAPQLAIEVVDESAAPVAGASVDGYGIRGAARVATVRQATTDSAGSCALGGFDAGEVVVFVRKKDFAPYVGKAEAKPEGEPARVSIRLGPGAVCEGVARYANGSPVPAGKVRLTWDRTPLRPIEGPLDADGRFRVDRLGAGGYRAEVVRPAGVYPFASAAPSGGAKAPAVAFRVDGGEAHRIELFAAFDPPGRIDAEVYLDGDRYAGDAAIALVSTPIRRALVPVAIAAGGRMAVPAIEPGSYRLVIKRGGESRAISPVFEVRSGDAATQAIRFAPRIDLAGRVVARSNGAAIAGASVDVFWQSSLKQPSSAWGAPQPVPDPKHAANQLDADATGRIRVGRLQAGTHELLVQAPGFVARRMPLVFADSGAFLLDGIPVAGEVEIVLQRDPARKPAGTR